MRHKLQTEEKLTLSGRWKAYRKQQRARYEYQRNYFASNEQKNQTEQMQRDLAFSKILLSFSGILVLLWLIFKLLAG